MLYTLKSVFIFFLAMGLSYGQPVDDYYTAFSGAHLTVPALDGVLNNDLSERTLDSDADGFYDIEETQAGSDPLLPTSFPSNGTYVSTNTELQNALNTANPGDYIILEDGVYNNFNNIISRSGTDGSRIIIRSKTLHNAVFTGLTYLQVDGSYLVFDGLKFENGEPNNASGAIRLYGAHNRLTNLHFLNFNGTSGTSDKDWVGLYNNNHRVDRCCFEGKNGVGPLLVVWRPNDAINNHVIDHNVFKNYASGGGSNGYETIRIGTSDRHNSDSFTTVENNYFESCDGEIEIISNKSGANTFRGNTFYECAGALTLRHGKGATVEDNLFITNGKANACGIRVIDSDHVIRNNYIEGIRTSSSARAGISLTAHETPANEFYEEVSDVQISHNSLINCKQSWLYGGNYKAVTREGAPSNVSFLNNITRNNLNGDGQYDLIRSLLPLATPIYTNECYFGSPLGGLTVAPIGVNVITDPNLEQDIQGLWIDKNGKGAQGLTRLYENDCGPLDRSPSILSVLLDTGVGLNGSLTLLSDGSFSFTPALGITGNVQFSYELQDGSSKPQGIVNITVYGPPEGDDDGDNVSNLAEYASGTDLLNPTDYSTPTIKKSLVNTSGIHSYVYSFQKSASAKFVTQTAYRSTSLRSNDWQHIDLSITPHTTSLLNGGDIIEYEIPVSSLEDREFFTLDTQLIQN